MDSRLSGRIAVITGASSGLGKATAIRFANSGARVVCSDLKSVGVEDEINKQHGKDRATFIKCNVGEESDIEALIKQAASWGGRVDILCNYAGIAAETAHGIAHGAAPRCHDFPTSGFDQTMTINCRGVWLCCKYALKQMLAQEPREANARGERTRGWIINAASMLGLIGLANTPAYTTSKHAVVGMTKQMAIDYAEDRIHINALAPGFVKSPMIQTYLDDPGTETALAARHPWNALGRPEDIADAALFLASDEAAWISGHSLVIDGAYTCQ
ncbi:hypothetical protein LTR35_010120 [Friedmanniomyces endolithicus]|uniref:Uncharacterized protein n=1 Tax=Friedmanniomyces endolithicus TaxID=329885 RepID=A0AAN6JAH3_9PEZI|nr:hypothetical protein LTR35_010120 [Friedmanniomyces endolithicus]KAK0317406.1 hypothetical protein LTR82_011729 [Friedmanniomyces endolithicus]